MKKHLFVVIITILTIAIRVSGQDVSSVTDTAHLNRFISALYIKPEVLAKNELSVRLNFDMPRYFRTISSVTGNMEKLSEKVVINEMYVNTYIDYGLTDKLTLFSILPLWAIHHSSPKGMVNGKGLSDIGIGADYRLIKSDNSKNSLTAEGIVFLPSGKSDHLTPYDYPLGMGVVRFKAGLTGMHRYNNSALVWSGYYELRPENSSNINIGDEAGISLIKQNYFYTSFGNFGIEYGALSYLKLADKLSGRNISHTTDYAIDIYAGAWFEYQKNLFLRFGIPYTIFQNRSFLTKYNVLIQLDYRFKP